MLRKILSIGTIGAVAAMPFIVVSCGTEAPQKNGLSKQMSITQRAEYQYKTAVADDEASFNSASFGTYTILDHDSYNALYHEMIKIPNTVGIALIANGNVLTDIVKIHKNESVLDILDSSKFIFKRNVTSGLGAFINSFALRDNLNVFMHGTNTEKNYGDYYPMYWINHKFAQLGVSNFHAKGHEMFEITFDKK